MNDKEIVDNVKENGAKITTNDNVDMVTYGAAVKSIVDGFFNEDGEYVPHFGRANAVGVFFQYFVDEESIDEYFTGNTGVIDLDSLLADDECMRVYNNAMFAGNSYRLNFVNAYKDAMEIVGIRTSTIAGVAEMFRKIIVEAINGFSSVMTEENINKLAKISDEISDGKLSADSIVEAFGKALNKEQAE